MEIVISKKEKLEEIAIKIDAHGKAAIENILTVGKLLCDAKKEFPGNNDFGEWREKRLPWINPRLSQLWMNAFKNNGEVLSRNNFATTVIYELTAPSSPESAREEATEHDKLTVKQSKDLVKAHKEVEELKAENLRLKSDKKTPAPANTENLIPVLKEMFEDGRIMPAMALKLSTMNDDGQQAWLTIQIQKQSIENQLNEKTIKIEELEARPEPEPTIIEKEVIPLDVQDKLKKAKTALADKSKAEKANREANEKASGARKANAELKLENKKLKEELGVNNPTNVDLAMEKKIRGLIDGVQFAIRELQGDMLNMGGGSMERSIGALEDLNEGVTLSVAALKGDSKQMIKATGV